MTSSVARQKFSPKDPIKSRTQFPQIFTKRSLELESLQVTIVFLRQDTDKLGDDRKVTFLGGIQHDRLKRWIC